MGSEITRAVAEAGYQVVMACYGVLPAQEMCRTLRQETGNEHIEVIPLDLARLSSVKTFAETVERIYGRVDLLMNNAGTMETGRHRTEDGLERTVSVNYVGPYLLTRLLLPIMHKGSRVVNMASCVFCLGKIQTPQFFRQGRKGSFWRIPVYSNTKLALMLFTLQLARMVKSLGITVNAADPGVVNTNIIRMHLFFDPLTDLFFRPFIRTPRQGAEQAIELLLDPDYEGQTGTFCRSGHRVNLGHKYVHHPQMKSLWEETERIVKPFLNENHLGN